MVFSKEITAVDIGSSAIKVARMKKKRGQLQMIDTGRASLPAEVLEEPEQLVKILADLFSEMKYRPQYVTTAVSSKNVIIRNIEFPSMSEKELSQALELGAEEYLTFPIENLKFKYKVLKQNQETMEILLAAINNEVLDNYVNIFERASLNLNVINVQPMALLSLVHSQLEITDPVMVVDIGARGSRIIIGDERDIYLVRNLEAGGETFSDILKRKYDLSQKEVRELKNSLNLDEELTKEEIEPETEVPKTFSPGEGPTSLTSLLDYFVKEIERSLEFFDKKYNNLPLEKIIFTGGGSMMNGLEDKINSRLENRLESLDPLKDLAPDKKVNRDYAVAVGLVASEVLANAV